MRSRRRSVPWIHRWSRFLIGGLAIVGAMLTAYLTIVKLTGGEVACGTDAAAAAAGCNSVLNSAYAKIFGVPLPVFGFTAYVSMATFALSPFFIKDDSKQRKQVEDWTWLLLLAGATAMAAFSGFLMYVLAFKLKAICFYCIGSATFSFTLLLLTLIGRNWEDIGQIFFIGIIVALVTLIGAVGVYANVDNVPVAQTAGGREVISQPTTAPKPPEGWEITTTSGEAEISLAKHLTAIGAKEYGAFWCPHCYDQKQLFGKEAFSLINYVECDPRGKNPQPQLCSDAGIQGFPSWEIKGKIYGGTQTLERLAELSGYTGPTNFKYTVPGF